MKSMLKQFTTIALATIVLILAVEVLGQVVYRFRNGYFLFNDVPEITKFFGEHPYLSVSLRKNAHIDFRDININTNEHGFRITSTPELPSTEDQKVVVCLGGSTTFSSMVSDEDSWPYLLQSKLGPEYKVYNLGAPGYSSMEAVIQMTTLVNELEPDIIINYHGWNDIRNYHIENPSADYYQHGMFLKQALPTQKTFKFYLQHSSILYYTGFFESKVPLASDGNPVPQVPSYTTPDAYEDSLYARNIRTLELLGNNIGAVNIFVPQIINVNSFANSEFQSRSWTQNIRDSAMPDLLQHFNQIMITSLRNKPETIVLEQGTQPELWSSELFADDGHFNPEGNLKFSEMIYKTIISLEEKD